MTRTGVISLIALTLGVGGALAAGLGLEDAGGEAARASILKRAEAEAHAERLFERADLDGDSRLSADEYAALSIVNVELSLLNGYMTIEAGEEVKAIALPGGLPGAMTRAERARVEGVSRHEFYLAAGEDGAMSAEEFQALKGDRFKRSDRNRNGRLAKGELRRFIAFEVKLPASGA